MSANNHITRLGDAMTLAQELTQAILSRRGAFIVCCLLALTGCSSSTDAGASSSATPSTQKPTTTKSAPTTTPQTTTTPPPQPYTYKITCQDVGDSKLTTVTITDYHQAWQLAMPLCSDYTASTTNVTYSTEQQTALDSLFGGDTTRFGVVYLACANPGAFSNVNGVAYFQNDNPKYSSATAQATLVLCPDHPQNAAIQAGLIHEQKLAEGKAFGSGSYIVGQQIQPGTYFYPSPTEDCYWALYDATGQIIDNYFGSPAQLVVTIPASAYSFENKCGYAELQE